VRRLVFATVAAVGLVMSTVPAASASAAGDSIVRGCFVISDGNGAATGDQQLGVIGDVSVTTDSSGAPTSATVTCWIDVNGLEAPGTRFSYSGTGVQAGADQISYAASGEDAVALCQEVVYADGSTDAAACGALRPILPLPIQCDLDWCVFYPLDSVLCPQLKNLVGEYGPITIAPDGDVYIPDPLGLQIDPFWDCPPYGNY
jgi:hypothetical protein